MKNIIVVEDKKISKQYEKRFVVVDKVQFTRDYTG